MRSVRFRDVLTGDPRHSILAVIVLFAAGAGILYFVDEKEGERIAGDLDRESGA